MDQNPLRDVLAPPHSRRQVLAQPPRDRSLYWELIGSTGLAGLIVFIILAGILALFAFVVVTMGEAKMRAHHPDSGPPLLSSGPPPVVDLSVDSIVLRNGSDDRSQAANCWSHRIIDLGAPADSDGAVNVSVKVRNRGNISVSPSKAHVQVTVAPDGGSDAGKQMGTVGVHDQMLPNDAIMTGSQRFVFPANSLQGRPLKVTATFVDADDHNPANDTVSTAFKPCS